MSLQLCIGKDVKLKSDAAAQAWRMLHQHGQGGMTGDDWCDFVDTGIEKNVTILGPGFRKDSPGSNMFRSSFSSTMRRRTSSLLSKLCTDMSCLSKNGIVNRRNTSLVFFPKLIIYLVSRMVEEAWRLQ